MTDPTRSTIRDVLAALDALRTGELADMRRMVSETHDAVLKQNGRLVRVEERVGENKARLDGLPCERHSETMTRLEERLSHQASGLQRWAGWIVPPVIGAVVGAIAAAASLVGR